MHFAYQPRKSSVPPAFRQRPPRFFSTRRGRVRILAALFAGAILFLVIFCFRIFQSHQGGYRATSQPLGRPPVVLVTVLDPATFSKEYVESIRQNRLQYARKHGYEVFFAKPGDYDVSPAPVSWTKVVAMRHALTKFSDCRYVWYLDQDAFIINFSLSFEAHLMRPARLESTMIKNLPVVPPDSIIRTFSHLRGSEVECVFTQDKEGLSPSSFVVRNGEWARFFLETWNDPLYRSYNFQKAEVHALEHIVQWHPTILSKLALVPQNLLNSYSTGDLGTQYQEGDFVVRFPHCQDTSPTTCELAAGPYAQKWRTSVETAST